MTERCLFAANNCGVIDGDSVQRHDVIRTELPDELDDTEQKSLF